MKENKKMRKIVDNYWDQVKRRENNCDYKLVLLVVIAILNTIETLAAIIVNGDWFWITLCSSIFLWIIIYLDSCEFYNKIETTKYNKRVKRP